MTYAYTCRRTCSIVSLCLANYHCVIAIFIAFIGFEKAIKEECRT